jgi:hydroxymethylglutaryl-CoA synthase
MALENLSYWTIANDEYEKDKVGIVIASDIAKYPLHSSGEYTQGAGSVSLLVKRNPRLVALEQIYGSFTRDENDFFRPVGCTTAVVNGKHSSSCYLDAMLGAFNDFTKKASRKGVIRPKFGECATDLMNHLLFHIPFPRMIEYASAAIFRQDWRNLSRGMAIEDEIGREPHAGDYESKEKYQAAETDYARRFAKSRQFREAFVAKIKDSATLSRQVGNIYTGSIFLGLASLLELNKICPNERICFGAYGSGCSSLVFSGMVQPKASNVPLRDLFARLEKRTQISIQEYERLHEGKMEKSMINPNQEFALVGIDNQGYRHYEYVA